MLILTFEDSEEEILNHIISYVSTGAKAFQLIGNTKDRITLLRESRDSLTGQWILLFLFENCVSYGAKKSGEA
jgi:hypothetical protein